MILLQFFLKFLLDGLPSPSRRASPSFHMVTESFFMGLEALLEGLFEGLLLPCPRDIQILQEGLPSLSRRILRDALGRASRRILEPCSDAEIQYYFQIDLDEF